MKTASVVSETKQDMWAVENKNPKFRYVIARKDDAVEMNQMVQKGYVPATGMEQFAVRSFDGKDDSKPGERKVRGGRIIMCCPMEDYEARKKAQAAKYVSPEAASESDARHLRKEGVQVISRSENEVGVKI